MSNLTAGPKVSTVPEVERWRFQSVFNEDVLQKVNGLMEFQVNIRGVIKEIEFTSANTDTALTHALNYIPTSFIVFGLSANMVIYNGQTPSTTSKIYLRSSAVGTATVFIF